MSSLQPINIQKAALLVVIYVLTIHSLHGQSWKLTPGNISRAINEASERINNDPMRPAYHLTPPAGCMGDPNGGIYIDGWYHIFYGLNPFSSSPGGWYWAHAKTKDFLHWKHFEPGITPAFHLGLNNIGSGSTFITENGIPIAFYSASKEGSMKFWRATFDTGLNTWHHDEDINPVLTLDHPGLPKFDDFWRDPFVFNVDGRTFMIACADLFDKNFVPVPIFEAENEELTSWEYKGILFTYPKHEFRNFEVPELRPLEDKWIFLASCDAPVDRTVYFLGDFDPDNLRFIPYSQGHLDYSGHYYAQETIQDDHGNLFLMAWIPGWDRPWLPDFREEDLKNSSEIWNGCFAIPRQLSLNKEKELIQKPVPSMKKLRSKYFSVKPKKLKVENVITTYEVLKEIRGNQLEINLQLELGQASFCGLNVLCDKEGQGGMYIIWSGDAINVDGVRVPMNDWKPGQHLQLQVFIDKQQVEVFINGGRYCVTRKVKERHITGDHVALTRLGGHAYLHKLDAWKLKSLP